MVDRGLLASVVVVLIVLTIVARTRRPAEPRLSDVALWPAAIGLLAGRLAALALDDPSGLRTIRNLLLVRGGVELWPGVAAGALLCLALLRRRRHPLGEAAGLLAPAAVAAWAAYALACVVRDGCPGPPSPIGLRPPGLTTTQLPVGVIVGLIGLGAALVLRKSSRRRSATGLVLAALLVVSGLRSLESIWLPSLADGPTRQTIQSLIVFVGTLTATLILAGRRARRTRRAAQLDSTTHPAGGHRRQPAKPIRAPSVAIPPPPERGQVDRSPSESAVDRPPTTVESAVPTRPARQQEPG